MLDLDLQNCEGNTPLHIAADLGSQPLVEFLISVGADASVLNKGIFIYVLYLCVYLCIFMGVCVRVNVYVCAYVYVNEGLYMCWRVFYTRHKLTDTHTYTRMHVHVYACTW